MTVPHRILVVDDDRLVLTTLVHGLQQAGFTILDADNGDDAIAIACEHNPDLALLDVRMHGKSGIDVARHLSAHTDVPFMFLSAFADAETVAEATAQGALGYLLKPLEINQIIPAIHAALARAEEIRGLRNIHSKPIEPSERDQLVAQALAIMSRRLGMSAADARVALDRQAKSQARPIEMLARDLIHAETTLYAFLPESR